MEIFGDGFLKTFRILGQEQNLTKRNQLCYLKNNSFCINHNYHYYGLWRHQKSRPNFMVA